MNVVRNAKWIQKLQVAKHREGVVWNPSYTAVGMQIEMPNSKEEIPKNKAMS